MGAVKRISARIVIPPGYSHEAVTATLDSAARMVAERTHADAVMVFGYRINEPPRGIYTVGRAIYAPGSDWGKAGEAGPKSVVVDLAGLYFAPPGKTHAAGDTVVLRDTLIGSVSLSNSSEEWGDANIVARVPNGTRAVVISRKSYPVINVEIELYRVRPVGKKSRRSGWVMGGDIHSR